MYKTYLTNFGYTVYEGDDLQAARGHVYVMDTAA